MLRGRSPARKSWHLNARERIPPEEIKEGAQYDGVVTWRSMKSGVFVDFGSVRDGILKVKSRYRRGFVRGMEVRNMTVVSCNVGTGRAVLEPDPNNLPEPSVSRSSSRTESSRGRSRSANSGTSRGSSAKMRSRSRLPRERRSWEHQEGAPFEELQEGKEVDGVVTVANRYGVFVDFGCVKDGRLVIPVGYEREFRVGDQIENLRIEAIDMRQRRIDLSVADLEATVEHLQRERVPLEDLEEGRIVDGIICNAGPYGVFVNIGATRDGKLKVPRRVELLMLRGEQVQGMRIEHIDLEKQRFSLVFDDGDEAEAPRQAARPPPAVTNTTTSPGAPKASVKAGSRPPPKKALTAPEPPPPPEPQDSGAIALEEIRVGELADGVVVSITGRGVMVDIGAETYGTLRLPTDLRSRFQINDMVEGMVVEDVDLKRRQVIVSMDDPELAVVDGRPTSPGPDEINPPRERARSPGMKSQGPNASGRPWLSSTEPTAKAKPHAKVKAKAKAT